ncbi:YdaS family helix-turn-helix protein [Chromobacterium subtsugae]|uniref:YdaS family helix-turn-helix protein n=1 Tax=Chromobacterium subtsugae TaxID=251747 RepID=UPI0006411D47|nr:YdaS family helix-turn-helix protein [Chromobacterium subtsugae]
MTENCVQVAVDKAGSIGALAKIAGVKYQAVQGWIRCQYIPPKRIRAVAAATGISEAELFAAYQLKQSEAADVAA